MSNDAKNAFYQVFNLAQSVSGRCKDFKAWRKGFMKYLDEFVVDKGIALPHQKYLENNEYIPTSQQELMDIYSRLIMIIDEVDGGGTCKEEVLYYSPLYMDDIGNNIFTLDSAIKHLDATADLAFSIYNAEELWREPTMGEKERSWYIGQLLKKGRPKIGGYLKTFVGFCPQCLLDNRAVLIRQCREESGECPECHLVLEFNMPYVWLKPQRGKSSLQNRSAMWLLSDSIRQCCFLKSMHKENNDHLICTKEELESIVAKIN